MPPAASTSPSVEPYRPAAFATTRWSIVLHAGRGDAPEARAALADLCRTYWFPLYAQVRRRGVSAHDAQDLTQAFFARLLENETLTHADPARGRFRSFVLTALKHFLNDEWARSRAQKRGGGVVPLSLDLETAEARLREQPSLEAAPDQAFDRAWALALLDAVLAKLEAEYRAAGKATQWSILKPALTGARGDQPYAAFAAQLGATEGAVKVAVHRLRRRYRELLETEIAHTVDSSAEVADELNHLFRALASR